MRTKTIGFDIELAKKIQNREEQGKIKTRDGRDVRIICWDRKKEGYPLVCLIKINENRELTSSYTGMGTSEVFVKHNDPNSLVLEIPDDSREEHQFKPFDKVLVRNKDYETWKADFFSHYTRYSTYKYNTIINAYTQCIPYKGNEHLIGITKAEED